MKTPVYLDYNATTPTDPRVLEKMLPFFTERFGNAASRHHQWGCDAAEAVERAREEVAQLIGADPREIIFTSGATEAVNLAIKGVVASPAYRQRRRHIVTVATEHKAVLDTCRYLQDNGCEITFLPVDSDGCLNLDELDRAVTSDTLLVSVMHANNETGVIHPVHEIAGYCKQKGVLFFTDATQAVGRVAIDVEAFGVDLLSLSAHKIYGPKGVGALYVRRRGPRARCEPLIHGGGHERGLRSGTMNVPGVVGLGAAASICRDEMAEEQERLRALRERFETQLLERISIARRNGHPTKRLANTSNISFIGLDSDELLRSMPDLAASSASACTSASLQPSYVLRAMGASEDVLRGSVRFSLGRFTTEEEIRSAVETVAARVEKLRHDLRERQSRNACDDTATC